MPEFPQVQESEAQGKVKPIFDDVRLTFGTATAPLLFRQLAVHPYFLQLAWRNLKTNASTVYFRRMSEELRDMAIYSVGGSRNRIAAADSDGGIQARLSAHSMMLLAVGALRAGTNGQIPKVSWISPAEKRSVVSQTSVLPPVDVDIEESSIARLSSTVPDIGRVVNDLRERASIMVESLPYRMEISATVCRQAGIGEDDIDEVRRILNAAWDVLARTLLAIAMESSGSKSEGSRSGPRHIAEVAGSVAKG